MMKPLIILIVDDEDQILTIYRTKLEQEGFRVVTAKNGLQAIEAARNEKPDLVIMDVKMPVMDGVEAALKLKEDPATKGVKIVFLSAFGDIDKEVDRKVAKEIGALDFIKKGISLNELVSEVRKHIG